MSKTKEPSNKVIRIRVKNSDYEMLKQKAEEAYVNISEYIRSKVLRESHNEEPVCGNIDSKSKFACDHDRELMRLLMRTYVYMKASIKESLPEDQYKSCNEMAKEQLKEWGYE